MIAPFRKLTQSEQRQAALPVLLAARKMVVLDGAEPIDAIQQAGLARIESVYARRVLVDVVGRDLLAWQRDSVVRQSDRTRAFDRAIRLARAAFGHRGGWVVSDAAGCR